LVFGLVLVLDSVLDLVLVQFCIRFRVRCGFIVHYLEHEFIKQIPYNFS
jgi:hypothetical protein